MSIFWLILFIVLLLVEIFTVGLVSIWFAIGAIVAMVSSFFIESIVIQGIVFVVTSILVLLCTKKIVQRFRMSDIIPTNLDRVIGKNGEVLEKIVPGSTGQVKVLGNIWSAVSSSEIEVGQRIIVKQIDGVKLIVEEEEK